MGGIDVIKCMGNILEKYSKTSNENFSDNLLANSIRKLPNTIKNMFDKNDRAWLSNIEFKGSPGQGNWAKVPWCELRIDSLAKDFQSGIYIVYLFDAITEKSF